MMGEHEHEVEHAEIRALTRIFVVNTWATALGSLAGWIALGIIVVALLSS